MATLAALLDLDFLVGLLYLSVTRLEDVPPRGNRHCQKYHKKDKFADPESHDQSPSSLVVGTETVFFVAGETKFSWSDIGSLIFC